MKKCTKCGIEKNEIEFKRDKRRLNCLSSWCKQCNREANSKYRNNNPELSKQSSKNWKLLNKIKISQSQKNRRAVDPVFKLKMNLRTRLKKAIKNQAGNQGKTSIQLLGCTGKEASNYLELKFENGMTWENYGKWHIDHIIPCDAFDLTKLEEQKKCFHYTNLQPLWAKDNLKKGNKIL